MGASAPITFTLHSSLSYTSSGPISKCKKVKKESISKTSHLSTNEIYLTENLPMESLNKTIQENLLKNTTSNGNSNIDCVENEFDDEVVPVGNFPVPFIKWVGGKRCLIKDLISHSPEKFETYYEPFVGGGALFFALHNKIKKAQISDSNLDLILTYRAIQKEPENLIALLKKHKTNHSKEYYYKIRKLHDIKNPLDKAARLIYLNRTCYNGLFRVNKSGEFNVPMGTYKNPTIVNEPNILACHKILKDTKIEWRNFDTIKPKSGDFVYCDPPYHPTDEISFTNYTRLDFTEKDQVNLRDFAVNLTKKGVKVMLSNSNTPFIRDIYKGSIFHINIVTAPRFVNCKKDKRNPVEEVIITNY
jgi:DNA adenine methylase